MNESFTNYIVQDDCWLWQGATSENGYALAYSPVHKSTVYVHHAIRNTDTPPPTNTSATPATPQGEEDTNRCERSALIYINTCGHKHCVNPEHWFEGTHDDLARFRQTHNLTLKGENHPSSLLTAKLVNQLIDDYLALIGEAHTSPPHPATPTVADVLDTLEKKYPISRRGLETILRKHNWKHLTHRIPDDRTLSHLEKRVPKGERHPMSKLTDAQVLAIRKEIARSITTKTQPTTNPTNHQPTTHPPKPTKPPRPPHGLLTNIAERYGVSLSTISRIFSRERWTHLKGKESK